MAAYCSSVAFLSCRPSLFAFHVLADPAPSVLCPSVCVRTVSRHKSALSYLDFFHLFIYMDCSKTGCFPSVSTIHPTWLTVFGSCVCDVCRQSSVVCPFRVHLNILENPGIISTSGCQFSRHYTKKKHTHKHLEQIRDEILASENTQKLLGRRVMRPTVEFSNRAGGKPFQAQEP